jgi:hypothetical protein
MVTETARKAREAGLVNRLSAHLARIISELPLS